MQNAPEKQPAEPNENNKATTTNEPQPHKHNPFEDKRDSLTKEEEDALEQFKEAQTERD